MVSAIWHIQFERKVTKHYWDRIQQIWSDHRKALSEKKYLERNNWQAHFCFLYVKVAFVQIWGQSSRFPLTYKRDPNNGNSFYFHILSTVWWPVPWTFISYRGLGIYSLNWMSHTVWMGDTSEGTLKVYGNLKALVSQGYGMVSTNGVQHCFNCQP